MSFLNQTCFSAPFSTIEDPGFKEYKFFVAGKTVCRDESGNEWLLGACICVCVNSIFFLKKKKEKHYLFLLRKA